MTADTHAHPTAEQPLLLCSLLVPTQPNTNGAIPAQGQGHPWSRVTGSAGQDRTHLQPPTQHSGDPPTLPTAVLT